MAEPINPQDHTIQYADYGPRPTMQDRALQEAIHQTFERDAANQKASEEDERDFNPPRDWVPDPDDTEIDRLARLIVQGEYRRRHNESHREDKTDA